MSDSRVLFNGESDKVDAFEGEIKKAADALFEICEKHAVPILMVMQVSKTNFVQQGAWYAGTIPAQLVACLEGIVMSTPAGALDRNCGDPHCVIHSPGRVRH